MAKQEMKRPEMNSGHKDDSIVGVQQLEGKAKHGKKNVRPIISGTHFPKQKVYHFDPHSQRRREDPISDIYPAIDNDLARDNIENDITAADLQDL